MKKIVLWAMTTVTALVLVLGYRTSTPPVTSQPEVTTSQPQSNADSGTGASSSPSTTGGTTDPATNPTTDPTTDPTTAAPVTEVFTGDTASTRWGPVQVEITVTDATITAVDVIQFPSGNREDEQINSRAIPLLVESTLQAQSASIDMVSGATVTSGGYVTSLQSALDAAGL